MMTDAELLRQYTATRADEAFAELVRRHVNLVYRAALRQLDGDTHRAEDAAQLVFTLLARRAGVLARHPSLTGWLYTTTHFTVSGLRRDERRRQAREREATLMHEITTGDGAADWERLRPVLDEVMQRLGERDRDALLARFFEGRSFGEVGARLALSEDAARMRVDRALEKLRSLLARRGVTSTGAALGLMLANEAACAAPAGLAASVGGGALAAAGAATASAAGGGAVAEVWAFMSTSKIGMGVAGLALAATFGGAAREIYAAREAETALRGASQTYAASLGRLQTQQQQADAAERAAAEAKKVAAAVRPAVMRSAQALDTAETEAFMARHPEVRRLALTQRRAQTESQYGPLFRELGLSPAEIERFKDLKARGMPGASTGPNGELIRYQTSGDRKMAQQELREMLGEEGFARLREYDEVGGPALQQVTELAGSLFDTATPLTKEQGEQLMRVLAENRVSVEWSGRRQYDWAAITAKAAPILTEAQRDVFARYRAADEFSQATTQAARRSATATSGGTTAPAK